MPERYYVCGVSEPHPGVFQPEIADDFALMVRGYIDVPLFVLNQVTMEYEDSGETTQQPVVPAWAANQELLTLVPTPLHGERFIVHADLTDAEHEQVAYSEANPNGYDWLEVADDGTVTVHAPQ